MLHFAIVVGEDDNYKGRLAATAASRRLVNGVAVRVVRVLLLLVRVVFVFFFFFFFLSFPSPEILSSAISSPPLRPRGATRG